MERRNGASEGKQMKKIGLIVLAVLGTASLAAAADRISFGLKAGLNSAVMVTADADTAWSARWLPVGGAFVCFSLSDALALQAELLYSPKGALNTQTDETTIITTTVFAPYIDIPVLLKYLIPTGSAGGLKPCLFAGPYLGFKAGAGTLTIETVGGGETSTTEDALADLKGTDFGFVLGAGVELPLDRMRISLDVRWTTSLSTISTAGDTTKNRVWSFLVGVAFN
jgi:hypothetical protein